jgi:hypothetical protein
MCMFKKRREKQICSYPIEKIDIGGVPSWNPNLFVSSVGIEWVFFTFNSALNMSV